jgi:hypothetical protein
MANRAFLMLNLSGDPNEVYTSESVAVGASACYPVLWWSLFSQADIEPRTEEWEDDEGDPVPVSFPCPMTSLTIARKRAKARQRLFFSYFPRTIELIYQQWLTLLEGIDAPFLQINTGEVWGMSEPERSNAEIMTYVRSFDEGRVDDWMKLLGQVQIRLNPETRTLTYVQGEYKDNYREYVYRELSETEIDEVIGYRLRGYSWERPVPWDDD